MDPPVSLQNGVSGTRPIASHPGRTLSKTAAHRPKSQTQRSVELRGLEPVTPTLPVMQNPCAQRDLGVYRHIVGAVADR